MKTGKLLGCLALACMPGAAMAETLHPTRISPAEAKGPIFSGPKAEKVNTPDQAVNVGMLNSADKKLTVGIYKAGASTFKAESYPIDEFMYFLEGSAKLTSEDGTVIDISAGDAVTIPKGWKGTWETKGYKKYYVMYSAEAIRPQ